MLDSSASPSSVSFPAAEGSSTFPPRRTRKIAILGFGETVKDAPVNDPSWELWAMNGFWRAAKPDHGIDVPESRYSLWFDMHSVDYIKSYGAAAGVGDAQERWLEQRHPFAIFMLDEWPEFPSARRFPLESVIEKTGRDYFTSSVAYAIALALSQDDVATIGLWGIDLIHSTEYADQRPCAEYWVGRAEAAGIEVQIHQDSALLKQRFRYGYDAENPLLNELRNVIQAQLASTEEVMVKNRAEMERMTAQMHTDDGARQFARGILERLNAWSRGGQI